MLFPSVIILFILSIKLKINSLFGTSTSNRPLTEFMPSLISPHSKSPR